MGASEQAERLSGELRERLIARRRAEAVREGPPRPLEDAVSAIVEERAVLLSPERRADLVDLVLRDTVGLGPLEELLRDPRSRR